MIRLTNALSHADVIYVSPTHIVWLSETESGGTHVQFPHTDEYLEVRESPEEILELLRAVKP